MTSAWKNFPPSHVDRVHNFVVRPGVVCVADGSEIDFGRFLVADGSFINLPILNGQTGIPAIEATRTAQKAAEYASAFGGVQMDVEFRKLGRFLTGSFYRSMLPARLLSRGWFDVSPIHCLN